MKLHSFIFVAEEPGSCFKRTAPLLTNISTGNYSECYSSPSQCHSSVLSPLLTTFLKTITVSSESMIRLTFVFGEKCCLYQ